MSLAVLTDDRTVSLRRVTAADEMFLRQLFGAVRADVFVGSGLTSAALNRLLDQQFHARNTSYAARYPDAENLLIARRGEPFGQLMMCYGLNHWHIIDITLTPTARDRGLGSDIMRAVARSARNWGACELTLSVLASNDAARRFYARLGFKIMDEGVGCSHVAMAMPLGV